MFQHQKTEKKNPLAAADVAAVVAVVAADYRAAINI